MQILITLGFLCRFFKWKRILTDEAFCFKVIQFNNRDTKAMVIVELTYKKPISEVERYLDDHKLFLNKNYQDKNFLASGAKAPRIGGIILSN